MKLKKNRVPAHDPLKLNIQEYMSTINPNLMNFLERITLSNKEKNGCSVGANTAKHNVRKLRLFFILCLLMYCANPMKPMAIHNLLANVVEVCGGSRLLLKILNNFGCVSSADTHDRFVTFQAELQRKVSVWETMSQNVFTIASTDNFDMLQSYASVFCGDQQRSYHGTTVQLVQPHQSLEFTTCTVNGIDKEVTSQNLIPEAGERCTNSQGEPTPKKRRTVAIRNIISSRLEPSTQLRYGAAPSLEIDMFNITSEEHDEVTITRMNLCYHAFQRKSVEENSDNWVINDFRLFMKCARPKRDDQQSQIHYLELVDENADSDDAMLQVVEDLLEKFEKNEYQKWVVLVGDGKTYQHLMRLKKQYGDALSQLLIFPGDWHILKNYQEVLMKIYYIPGLKEIAMGSGYRGTTLQSLENAKSFKRTHVFLLQAWEALTQVMITCYLTENQQANLMSEVQDKLQELIQNNAHPETTLHEIERICEGKFSFIDFMSYVEQKGSIDDTWKLWKEFVFNDCFAYIGLYAAMRCRNWTL